jgi:probable HAF family extracellular repeat protein
VRNARLLRVAIAAAIGAAALLGAPAAAQAQLFQPLTGNFGVMSRGGTQVLTVQTNGDIYRWSAATGQVPLGLNVGTTGYVVGVTDDGSVVAGYHRNSSNVTTAFRWTAAGGFVDFGDLPGGSS